MKKLINIWNIPNYPLTETFGKFETNFKNYNQTLSIDKKSLLVQLKNKLPSKKLYAKNNYFYKTNSSSIKKKDLNKFINFTIKNINRNKVKKIIDVGSNDLTVIKKFGSKKRKLIAIDPNLPEKKNSKITFIRKYIEELNFSKVFKNVDLVICRHTLEHIRNPKKILKKIFKEFNPETKIIIEVPDFNKMLKKLRLDAIIHQHYYYFEKETLNNVINESGGRVTDILEYDDGPCGGSLLICCEKAEKEKKIVKRNLNEKINHIKKRIGKFKKKMQKISKKIK